MASTDPAEQQTQHLLHPRSAAEQLDAIFTGREHADDGLIAGLARQLLAEYHRIAGTPGIEWGVRYRWSALDESVSYRSEAHARVHLDGAGQRTLVHRRVVVRRDEVGPWIDGEPKAGG